MAPATVARRFAILVISLRGKPTGDEGIIVDDVRARLGQLPKKATLSRQQKWLCLGLALIVDYAIASFSLNALSAFADVDFGDRLYEFAKIIATRTKLFGKFSEVIDDTLEWEELVRTLVRHRDGVPVSNPL